MPTGSRIVEHEEVRRFDLHAQFHQRGYQQGDRTNIRPSGSASPYQESGAAAGAASPGGRGAGETGRGRGGGGRDINARDHRQEQRV